MSQASFVQFNDHSMVIPSSASLSLPASSSPVVYRYERSGTMHGLFRVRGFTQASGSGQLGCCAQAW